MDKGSNITIAVTYAAVVRSSSDRRRVLTESANWNTRRDAETLGVAEVARVHDRTGVLCIEERHDPAITNHPQDPAEVRLAHELAEES